MKCTRVTLVFVAVGAGCYTTPRTSWPDADFSTAGHGGAGAAGTGPAGIGGGSGGSVGGQAGLGSGGSAGGQAGSGSGGSAGGQAGSAGGNGGSAGTVSDAGSDAPDSGARCGDGIINGSEVCDSGGSGSTDLGACNPECTGYYEKKYGRVTANWYPTDLGGIAGADAKCQAEFGSGWKALLVGGTRIATRTPFVGDGQDWVIKKYTHYYNTQNQLAWRTDAIPLLGVRNGARLNLYATFFDDGGIYPWAGWDVDWTTLRDSGNKGTCNGWTNSNSSYGWGSFVTSDLMTTASETCGSSGGILCVQQ
jgi:hypothetical protein